MLTGLGGTSGANSPRSTALAHKIGLLPSPAINHLGGSEDVIYSGSAADADASPATCGQNTKAFLVIAVFNGAKDLMQSSPRTAVAVGAAGALVFGGAAAGGAVAAGTYLSASIGIKALAYVLGTVGGLAVGSTINHATRWCFFRPAVPLSVSDEYSAARGMTPLSGSLAQHQQQRLLAGAGTGAAVIDIATPTSGGYTPSARASGVASSAPTQEPPRLR